MIGCDLVHLLLGVIIVTLSNGNYERKNAKITINSSKMVANHMEEN